MPHPFENQEGLWKNPVPETLKPLTILDMLLSLMWLCIGNLFVAWLSGVFDADNWENWEDSRNPDLHSRTNHRCRYQLRHCNHSLLYPYKDHNREDKYNAS